jgi:small conductance mechanosensitive channel
MSRLDLLENLVLPDDLLLFRFLITIIVFAIAFVVYRIFSLAIKRVGKRTFLHRAVLSQIRWTLGMILIVAAFVPILWIWEIDLTALGLSLGIVAVAIGLASQNIVTNFLSGLLLLVERIYRLGDVIQIDEMRGRVIQIGLQGTKLWTEDNIMVSIPNAILAKSKILNMSNSPNETTLRNYTSKI